MLLSAEVRWFWRDAAPRGLADWFREAASDGCTAGGGARRTDCYLIEPGQTQLGIKQRGGRAGVEVKGLIAAMPDGLRVAPFSGPIELWGKWSSGALRLGDTVRVDKQRWVRTFDTSGGTAREIALGPDERARDAQQAWPARGCNVELTCLTVADEPWWTFGFEAFGPLDTLRADLHAGATRMATRQPPAMPGGAPLSYPAWLDRYLARRSPVTG